MSQHVLQTVSGDVVVFWRGRIALLGEKLRENPGAESAWFWQVQWDILNHLLHRYAGDVMREPPALPDAVPFALSVTAIDSGRTENMPLATISRFGGEGKLPRDSAAMRLMLERISEGNRQRYEVQRRLCEEIAEALRAEGQRIHSRVWRLRMMCDLLDAVGVSAIPSSRMSDDHIDEILSKIVCLDELPERGHREDGV